MQALARKRYVETRIAVNHRNSNGNRVGRVVNSGRRFKVRRAFDDFALPADRYSQSRYDEHMGSVTKHYDIMKAFLAGARRHLLSEQAKKRGVVSLADVGCGTGELIAFIVKEVYVPFIKAGGKVTVTLIDPAGNMLEIAERKLAGLKMQLPKGLQVKLLQKFIEFVKPGEVIDNAGGSCDIALATYVAPWVENVGTIYENTAKLLGRRGKLISIEENPLVLTPSASLPEDFERVLAECAKAIEPNELVRIIRSAGFRKNRGVGAETPIDDQHTMYLEIYTRK